MQNGATEPAILSPAQLEQLRQMLQPLVLELRALNLKAQLLVTGFLQGAGFPQLAVNVDLNTGTVTPLQPQVPAAIGPARMRPEDAELTTKESFKLEP